MSQANAAHTLDSAQSASIYAADGAPSLPEIDDMWLRLREQEAADRRSLERARRAAVAPILERADADEAQERRRIQQGLQCPECYGVRIETRPSGGWLCTECGCQWSPPLYGEAA